MNAILFSTLMMTLSPSPAQAPAMTITVTGQGKWEVLCHVSGKGDDETVFLTPARGSLSRTGVKAASCQTTSPARGPITFSLVGALNCPLRQAPAGTCEQAFRSGSASLEYNAK